MTRFRRILVPHDFSDAATDALRFAAGLVTPRGRILVLHVVVPFTPVTSVPAAAMAAYVAPDEIVRDAAKHLDRMIATALPPAARSCVETKVVIGDPYQRIMAAARGMDAI